MAPERAVVEIRDIEHVARTTLQEVREAVASYRQPTLSSELQGAQEILAAAGIAYRYEGDESTMDGLPTAIEAVLAWTVREGVTNIIRHSRARHCSIHITRERQTISVEIIDDGVGVPLVSADQLRGIDTGSAGHGLRGLAERVSILGGQFDAGSCVDGGFRLAISLPLTHRAMSGRTPGTAIASPAQQTPTAPPKEHPGSNEERSTQW